jgi:hypothetical protein
MDEFGLGYNTMVSDPGYTQSSAENTNGANLPGNGLQAHHGVVVLITTAAVTLIAIRMLFTPKSK